MVIRGRLLFGTLWLITFEKDCLVGRVITYLLVVTWIKWETVCLKKEEGGLGVRRLKEFNLALLSKWWWRILQDQESLWYQVLCARYGEEAGG